MTVLKQPEVQQQIKQAIFVAKALFDRNKVSGSSANFSFRAGDAVVISASGCSLGAMTEDNFTVIDLEGTVLEGPKPSKEAPLHLAFYRKDPKIGAVLHTHSFYSVLWSCLKHQNEADVVPKYTPYLEMKLGRVGLIPYAPPGSAELFKLAGERIHTAAGFLLAHHGPVVPGRNIMDAFNILEELEESCRIAWYCKDHPEISLIP